jgi:hypothetical protein
MDRIDRIKKDIKSAQLVLFYPVYPVHPVKFFFVIPTLLGVLLGALSFDLATTRMR